MVSFLQRLKGKGVGAKPEDQKKEREALKGLIQLDIDLYETGAEMIIYAPVPGTNLDQVEVKIEGDNDVIVLEGECRRPEEVAFKGKALPEGKFLSQDIRWGKFYRKIILPEAVSLSRAEAKIKDGVLVLKLPIQRANSKHEQRLKVTRA